MRSFRLAWSWPIGKVSFPALRFHRSLSVYIFVFNPNLGHSSLDNALLYQMLLIQLKLMRTGLVCQDVF